MVGSIDPAAALEGYSRGLFPMGASRDDNVYAWFTHVPRGILPLDGVHISKSLKKELRREPFEITSDRAFENVIHACAVGRDGDEESATWIAPPVRELFIELHHRGHAHSIECWQKGELVGGLYGLHLGGAFFGESTFSIESNASKVALVYLAAHMQRQGFSLLDTQQTTPHTVSMGAIDISEIDYLVSLQNALTRDVQWGRLDPRFLLDHHILQT